MWVSWRNSVVFVISLLSVSTGKLWADAIVINQAMRAETIAQYYVEEDGVRLELEMGLAAAVLRCFQQNPWASHRTL